ncbi:Rib/alpha-like domain-containing protein, partial [Streptococcus parasanguinis]|uniref:Rib/alpha-like domain-containing protein n=1 Tax=Streptococcus parasanguinis TaxID=1318 RepID=UPI00321BCA3D
FSVRKYHFGAASVLLGTALVFGGAQASADEVTAPATPSTESTTATSAETTTASEGAPAVLTASEGTPASLTASESSSSTEATSLDKGALQVALSQAKALDLSNKTSETVAILLAQIEHAQTVLNTATSQEELNQAVTDLQAAQAQLADKPATTPASVTPATPASSETSSQPSEQATSEAAQPSHGRRSRRDLSATGTPIEAVDAAAQAAEKKDLEDKNAKLKSDYDAAVAHYNSEIVRINADNAAKKTAYDTAYAKYQADKKDYEDHLAANLAAAEAAKNTDGHLSKVKVQHLKFLAGSEPDATVKITKNDGTNIVPNTVITTNVGDEFFADYTGLKNSYYDGKKIARVTTKYIVKEGVNNSKLELLSDPAMGVWFNPNGVENPINYNDRIVKMEMQFYYEDGTKVVFDPNKPALFSMSSLNSHYPYYEFAQNFSGEVIPITGSAITTHSNNRYYSDVSTDNKSEGSRFDQNEWDTKGPNEYYGAIAGVANGDKVSVELGTSTGGGWLVFDSNVKSADLIQNTAVQPTVPTYETLPTAPTAPTYFTISNRLTYNPTGQDLNAKHNGALNAGDAITNKSTLPTGTTYTWKGTAPDTSTPGTKPATVTVGYPDGSSEDVAINVNVTPRADDFAPTGKDVPAKHGDTPSAASGIANKGDLPADATYTWKGTAPDTTTPGDKPATVVVTYDDGTVDEV